MEARYMHEYLSITFSTAVHLFSLSTATSLLKFQAPSLQTHFNSKIHHEVFIPRNDRRRMCSSSVSVPSAPAISTRPQADKIQSVTAQTEEPCTYTVSPCRPIGGPTETITVYEQPFTATATATYDCQGCGAVTVEPRFCGVGPVSPSSPNTGALADHSVRGRLFLLRRSISSMHRLPPPWLFAAQLLTERIREKVLAME